MYRSGGCRAAWAIAVVAAASGCARDGGGSTESTAADDDASVGTADTMSATTGTTSDPMPDTSTGSDGSDDDDDVDTTADDTGPSSPWSTSLMVDERVGTFLSVWGERTDALYAVGGQASMPGELTVGALYRYDGRSWSAEALPENTPTLNWVYGVGDLRIMVGEFGAILARQGDEGPWTSYSCATILPLWGVWGASPDDVWIVGGDGFNRDPVLCHFDGEAVVAFEYPEPSLETYALFKVWGTSADHVFAVGDNGYLLHWDGVQWSEQDSGTTSDLISLWGRGPDEILAVGGRASGVLSRWDGRGWTSTPTELPGLNGVFMTDDGVATIVGVMGTAARVAAGDDVAVQEEPGTLLTLHAVYGAPDGGGAVFAVGGSLDLAPPFVGIVLAREP